MSAPLVTVLMAVHDGQAFVGDAIRSVLGQTVSDLELLVVDDASGDATAEVVASFDDPRVRLLRNERNLGQAPSLNVGLEAARGRYVARLDADDTCLPHRLERQLGMLAAEPGVAVVGSWMELVDEGGHVIGMQRGRIRTRPEFLFQTLVSYVLISHPAATYRREIVLDLGGYAPELAPSEDKDLWRRLALAGWDGRIVEEPLVRYRIHGAQLSQVQAGRQQENDARSQETFLHALDGRVDARPLRLLLADRDELWQGGVDAERLVTDLERTLAGARRLGLSDEEAAQLERLVARRVLRNARRGWRGSAREWRRASPVLLRWAAARVGPVERAGGAAAYAVTAAGAPVLRRARARRRHAVRRLVELPALAGLRRSASRSRLLRLVYGRLIGSR